MWPNSPAMPSRPRTRAAVPEKMPAPIPSETVDRKHVWQVAQLAEPALRKQAGAGGVLHHDGRLEAFLELGFQIGLGPGRVRSKHQLVRFLVDAPGHAHAHALDQAAAKCGLQGGGCLGDGGDGARASGLEVACGANSRVSRRRSLPLISMMPRLALEGRRSMASATCLSLRVTKVGRGRAAGGPAFPGTPSLPRSIAR